MQLHNDNTVRDAGSAYRRSMESLTVIERAGVPGAAHLAAELLDNVDDLTRRLVENILAGDFSYTEGTLLTIEQLTSAVHDNLYSLLSTLSGQGVASLDAASAAGRLKARQGVPLAALLHAYRLAGRLIWSELVALAAEQDSAESLVHLASDVWAIIDDFSGAAADAYREYVADQTRQGATSRDVMLTALLDGTVDGSARAREIMRLLNLADRAGYVVVCAEIGSAGTEPLPGIEDRLLSCEVSSAWIQHTGQMLGLLGIPAGRTFGPVYPLLAAAARARVGVSRVFTSPDGAAGGRREAQLAARCLPPGERGSHLYGASALALLIATAPDAAMELTTTVLGPVIALPPAESALLLGTLQAWFDARGSSAKAARELHCHRNTVLYRLNRLGELTGRTVTDPLAGAELRLALETIRLSGTVVAEVPR